jgi:hypothetical protein
LLEQVHNGEAEFSEVEALPLQIDALQADVRTAANILGRLSPWLPHVQDDPTGAAPHQVAPPPASIPREFQLAVDEFRELTIAGIDEIYPLPERLPEEPFRFPQLKNAAQWLRDNGLATEAELAAMSFRERQDAISAPGINSLETLEKLRNALAESLEAGEDLRDFRNRIKGEVDILRHQEETIYRTKTKQAYVDGLEQTLDAPGVKGRFTHVVFNATDDTRVRDHHWEMDGMVAERGSQLHKVMLAILKEWNCRCSVTPIDRAEAETRGENGISDLSADFRSHFDVSLAF